MPLAEHTRHHRFVLLQPDQCLRWCVSSLPMLLEAGAGLPTDMDGHGSCPDRASISLIRVSRKSLCEIFFRPHEDIKGCKCWQWPGPKGGKRAFLSTSMFKGWPCSYWPSYQHCQHATCDGYNPPQLPVLLHSHVHRNDCLLWVDNECLSGGTHLSYTSTPQPSSQPGPYLNVTTLQSQCLEFEVLSI